MISLFVLVYYQLRAQTPDNKTITILEENQLSITSLTYTPITVVGYGDTSTLSFFTDSLGNIVLVQGTGTYEFFEYDKLGRLIKAKYVSSIAYDNEEIALDYKTVEDTTFIIVSKKEKPYIVFKKVKHSKRKVSYFNTQNPNCNVWGMFHEGYYFISDYEKIINAELSIIGRNKIRKIQEQSIVCHDKHISKKLSVNFKKGNAIQFEFIKNNKYKSSYTLSNLTWKFSVKNNDGKVDFIMSTNTRQVEALPLIIEYIFGDYGFKKIALLNSLKIK